MIAARIAGLLALISALGGTALAASPDEDIAVCVRAEAQANHGQDTATLHKDCACLTPALASALSPDDYAFHQAAMALVADGVTNEIDFHDEILAFLATHYQGAEKADDAPARIDMAQNAAQKACGIAQNP